jgi:hypothetical protein
VYFVGLYQISIDPNYIADLIWKEGNGNGKGKGKGNGKGKGKGHPITGHEGQEGE